MTEVPEHLLKRSKERRAAIGGEEAPAGEAPAAEAVEAAPAAPEPVAAAVAATPEPAPAPPPMRPEVAAAVGRKKIPFWALPVLVFLPLWAYVYQATLEPAPTGELTPVEQGGLVYHECAACHGGNGAGISAPALDTVRDTWPDYRDHMLWVKLGSTGWSTYSDTYGAPKKPVKGGMPPHPSLSDQDLALVVLYERASFGGLTEKDEEYQLLLDIADGKTTFADAGLGDLAKAASIPEDALTG